jgi:hypothetical protein
MPNQMQPAHAFEMLTGRIPPFFKADDVTPWNLSQHSGNAQRKIAVHVSETTTNTVECTLVEQPLCGGNDPLGLRSPPETSGRVMAKLCNPTFVSPGKAPFTKGMSLKERSPTGVSDFAADVAITPY